MIRWQTLWAWCLLLAGAVLPVQGAERTPPQRLADQFVRDAAELLETEPLTSEYLDAAMQLVQEAIALAPQDAELWRLARDVASLAEREDLREQAIEQVAKLDPADEVARLMRLSLAVERYQTAEERIDAYETLLSEGNRWQLGDAVASRLALDLALLHRRRNDMAAFSRWLGEAAAIDPGNRSAAALAAGFYMASGGEPYGGAELLVNLMLADPGDLTTRSTLASLLLDSGAYDGAARVLSNLVDHRYLVDAATGEGWLINRALAQWAAGEPDVALATLDRRQRDADHRHRGEARRDQPDLSALEIARMTSPPDPKLATLAAAIRSQLGPPGAADAAVADAVDAFKRTIDELATEPDADPRAVAQLHLELAWVASWLGADARLIEQHVEAADGLVELTGAARQRFAGWQALRDGDPAGAEATLAPLADSDPAAHLGLALARLDQGDRRDAAMHLRDIARAQPGAMLGVWAGEALFEILGRRAPLTDDANRLNDLIQSVPRVFDRYLDDPSLCFGLRLEPTEVRFEPMTPVIIDAVIANNSTHPLSIDRDGPLRPQLLLQVSARVPGAVRSIDLEPIIVDIDRAVTLSPKQRLRVPVNLSRTSVGRLLRNNPVPGMILRIKGTINFVASIQGAIVPGMLGVATEAPPVRVEGVRISHEWIEEAMAEVVIRRPQSLEIPAMLSHIAAAGLASDLSEEEQQLLHDGISALAEAFLRLDPVSQAWLLAAMQAGPAIEPVIEQARQSEQRLVRLALVLYRISDADDPTLAEARSDPDPVIRQMAEFMTNALLAAEEG